MKVHERLLAFPFLGSVFIGFLLVLMNSTLAAQTAPDPDSDEGQLEWSLGGGIVVSPRPYVGADPKVIPIPVIGVDYKRWFFQGIRGGYRLIDQEKWKANFFGQMQFKGLEASDSEELEGVNPRRKSIDGGLELIYQGRPVGFRAAFLTDVLGRNKGQEVALTAVTGAPLGKVLLLVGAGPRWLSERRVDYYYGVDLDEVRPGREAYNPGSAWSWDLNITARIAFNPKWTFFVLMNREGLGSEIHESPLLERTSAYSLVAYLARQF